MSARSWILLVQVALLSGGFSVIVKYAGIRLPATLPVELALIGLPALGMALLLWRWQEGSGSSDKGT